MPLGKVANELLYRHDEPRLEVVEQGRPWSFDGDGARFRLVSEAHRIRLAHLFDPVLAVHTSLVDPLPHQITAVYDAMLTRQPLRFLLADDPGAGKTIMAGLLMKELIARGDLQRCLVMCSGNLAEQWQDELHRRGEGGDQLGYGERPDVRARLTEVVSHTFDLAQLQELLEERALAHDAMDASRVHRIRENMERAEARRLQPHYVESFFLEAFGHLGGSVRQREPRRYEITHVPAPVRHRDRLIGIGEPVLPRYERIAFEKSLVAPQGQPLAAFVCPGHPLLDAVIDLTLERYRDLLRRGAVLVDGRDSRHGPLALH